MKKIILILTILITSTFVYSFDCMKEDLLISLVFYQIGKYDDSHVIIFKESGKGFLYYGIRDIKFEKTLEMKKIVEQKELLLEKKKINILNRIVNDIRKNGNLINNNILKDGWKIQIITKNNFIDVYFGEIVKYSWFKILITEIVDVFAINKENFPWKMIFLRYK